MVEEMDRRVIEENLFDQSGDEVQGTKTRILLLERIEESVEARETRSRERREKDALWMIASMR